MLLVVASATLFVLRSADAAGASVTVTATVASSGRITSINGTVSTVSPGVLRWRPSRTVNVAVGARFSIPLYGLRLPAGGPWTLGFKATGTSGAMEVLCGHAIADEDLLRFSEYPQFARRDWPDGLILDGAALSR